MNKIILKDNNINKIIVEEDLFVIYDNTSVNVEYIIENKEVNIFEYSNDLNLNSNIKYSINGGIVNVNKFYFNLSVNEKLVVDLNNELDKIDFCFSNICRGIENYSYTINHNASKTYSNISNKAIGLENSEIFFDINSYVFKNSIDCYLNQNTRIVTMGDCNAKVKPNMFIDLDDVSAKHGSVIGRFKDEDIFYLMSKGINYNDAMKLLVKGLILGNINVIYDMRLMIMDILNKYWR